MGQPLSPQRATLDFTTGNPNARIQLASMASAPNIGGTTLASAVRLGYIVGLDSQTTTNAVGVQADGATVTISGTVSFANLPTPFTPGPNDTLYLMVTTQYSNPIAGLAFGGETITPQGIVYSGTSAGASVYTGPKMLNAVAYNLFQAKYSATFVAAAATAAGTITVTMNAILVDIPG